MTIAADIPDAIGSKFFAIFIYIFSVIKLYTFLRIKKVSLDGKVSKPITISRIDGGRSTGVPQLEIFNNEIFIVWTVSKDEMNQLKTVKLSSRNI